MRAVHLMRTITLNVSMTAGALLAQPPVSPTQSAPAPEREKVVAYDYEDKEVYRSPQAPSWAGWIALCKLRGSTALRQAQGPEQGRGASSPSSGGDLLLSFLQITGDTKRKPDWNMLGLKRENFLLRSSDGGKNWKNVVTIPVIDEPNPPGFVFNGGNFATLLQLTDGSVLGTRLGRDWGSKHPKDGLVFRSNDEGKTWSEPWIFNDVKESTACPSRMLQLRDGAIMVAYHGCKIGYPEAGPWAHAGVYLSNDQGKTWEGPDIIAPDDDGLVAYPEPCFVEFDDGELLFLFRIETYPDPNDESKCISTPRRQCLVRKKRGHYVAGPITKTSLPHAGHPELLLTKEGVLLYMCEAGYWYTLDRGKTWTKMDLHPSYYYPNAVQLDDGRILVVGHVGGDEPFPPPHEMTIHCQWFRVRRESK